MSDSCGVYSLSQLMKWPSRLVVAKKVIMFTSMSYCAKLVYTIQKRITSKDVHTPINSLIL